MIRFWKEQKKNKTTKNKTTKFAAYLSVSSREVSKALRLSQLEIQYYYSHKCLQTTENKETLNYNVK